MCFAGDNSSCSLASRAPGVAPGARYVVLTKLIHLMLPGKRKKTSFSSTSLGTISCRCPNL